jgi:hypothetical protein
MFRNPPLTTKGMGGFSSVFKSVTLISLEAVWNDTYQINHQNAFPLDGGRLGWG